MSPRFKNPSLLRLCSALAALVFAAGRAAANPAGLTVAAGSATAVQNGSQLNITASQNAVLNWQSFNIGANETTTFQQPNNVSVVWNRIADANPSQIWGHLNANGIVVLMNQNGFYFGPNSSVNVGGFVAAGVWVTPPASVGGAMWSYQGPPPAASIINYGEIKANNGGSLFLVAEKIENHGVLTAPDGTLGLYAGKQVLISERPDGRGLSANVALPDGAIDNLGKISADAGTIALHAQVVNQNGIVQANSVRDNHGVIELVASDAVNLGADSVIQASGDDSGASAGGQITIKSANSFADAAGSRLEVRGGANGGDGGTVEISATEMPAVKSRIDGMAQAGSRGGRLLLDPDYIELGTPGAGSIPGALQYDVSQDFVGMAQIQLQAARDILLDPGTTWNLFDLGTTGNLLTLQAGNNIIFGDGSSIAAGNGWSVQLLAGADLTAVPNANGIFSPSAVIAGKGGIYLNGDPANPGNNTGGGSIQTGDGNITLLAGHEVIVGGGYVRTGYADPTVSIASTAGTGGNISIRTGDGDVDAGTDAATYDFSNRGYAVSAAGLGGISTADGGNVSIRAGRDILGLGANIGAFGAAAGDVSLTAGRDLVGNFMLRNGTGTALAGRDVGTGANGGSFGLVNGTWNVNAAADLYLNEVFNPNGALNNQRVIFGAKVQFQYDYAPDATVNLAGGNSVQLLGNNLAQTPDDAGRPPIYAPILNISAGAGGVTLGNDVVLYPSALGSLNILTTDGGSLRSSAGNYYQLIVSDSGSAKYPTFANGHAAPPLHLGETTPVVQLDIGGDLQNLFIRSPGEADIHVHGNTLNFSFEGQNLAATEMTKLTIDGNFFDRADHTSVTLADAASLDFLTDTNLVVNVVLANRVTYDPVTHKLDIRGIMTAADLDYLLHPTQYLWDPVLGQHYDAQGNPIIVPASFTTDTTALAQLYAASQDVPTSPLASKGLLIGGPGRLQISAQNMDLGISSGIRSDGVFFNPALAGISPQGADIQLTLGGNLDITSSQIASFNGGSIDVESAPGTAGYMNIGSQESFTSDSTPKGIYTGHGGDVTVHAGGDVLVNGSRIASYDGGDVTVISDHGKVDAGNGAKGFFYVTTGVWNPLTGQVELRNDKFFGSGIMALTAVDSQTRVGDINIRAGGDIVAGSGGVLQIAFNNYDQTGAQVSLDAGGSILASQSGILGRNVNLTALGDITGIIVAAQNVRISAQQNVAVTALGGGGVSVSGQSVSGTIVGGGNVSVAGSEVSATAISTGGAVSGSTSGATTAFAGVAAPAAQKTADDAEKTVAAAATAPTDDEELKKRGAGKSPVLAQKVNRVTVILPKKS